MVKRVAVLHSAIAESASKDEQDTLVQVGVVSEALRGLGFEPVAVPFSFDTKSSILRLQQLNPLFVFNLVEAIEGVGRFQHLAPMVLEHLGLPYTGANSQVLFLTTDKLLTKRVLGAQGIPTPDSFPRTSSIEPSFEGSPRYLRKSVHEDASIGIDEHSVVAIDSVGMLEQWVLDKERADGGEWFAERYIDGREFNVGFVSGQDGGLRALPTAEIRFDAFPPEKLRIVDYRAKWDVESFEYEHTDVHFDFPASDRELLTTLEALSLQAVAACGIKSYCRLDFRVDSAGQPWILELNANPCIAPDAGYAIAAAHGGLSLAALVESIVAPVIERLARGRSHE